jgi:acyl-CoA synthetase (AMP-forming)/AMP-acid ligase II/acyl carrier protein
MKFTKPMPQMSLTPNFSKLSTIIDFLSKRAFYQPDRLAYTFLLDGETEEANITYQQLELRAIAIACELTKRKAAGERALLLYPPGLEFIAAFFGCLYAGVIAVPVFPPRRNQRMSRLQAIVKDAQAAFALTTTSVLADIEISLKQESELATLSWIATDNLALDPAQAWQAPEISGDTLAFLQYTSGSTGTPKGVMVTHTNLLHNLAQIYQAFGHSPDSQGLIWLPSYHDMGLIGGVLQPLYGGFPVTLMSPFAFLQKPLRWLKAISRYKATTSGGPNFAYDLCMDKINPSELANLDLSSWEVAFNGAEPIRAETLERFATMFAPCGFRKEAFYPCYGMAETTLLVSGGLKENPPVLRTVNAAALEQNQVVAQSPNQKSRTLVSCGKTWLGQKVVIVNPDSLLECPANNIGEIWVAGASVGSGYWKRPLETEQAFNVNLKDCSNEPFLRTGDLGFLSDGELFVTGRLKDIIIIRGRNHYPQDIELTVQQSHPALRPFSGVAFSVEVKGQERLVVVQEVERSYLRRLDVDEVVQSIRQAISSEHELQVYAIQLLVTNSLPKTSSGKIQRHACRNGFISGSLDIAGSWTLDPEIELLEIQADIDSLLRQLQNSEKQKLSEDSEGLKNSEISKDSKDLNKSPEETSQSSHPTQETIENWLVTHLALYLKVPSNDIEIEQPFTVYGLDSSVAISMTGELGEWLGHELEPTLFWEYPNIQALAEHLEIECKSLHD